MQTIQKHLTKVRHLEGNVLIRNKLPFLNFTTILFLLIIAGYPLVGLLSAALDIPSRYITIPYRLFVATLSLYLIAVAFTNNHRRKSNLNCFLSLLYLWLTLYSLRLITNLIIGYPGADHQLIFFSLTVLLPLIAMTVNTPKLIEHRANLLTIALCAVVAVACVMGEFLGIYGANSYMFTGKLSTYNVNYITLGHVAVCLLLSLIALTASCNQRTPWLYIALGALGIFFLNYTGSRGPLVALVGSIIFWQIAQYRSLSKTTPSFFPSAVVILSIGLFIYPLPSKHLIENSLNIRLNSEICKKRSFNQLNSCNRENTLKYLAALKQETIKRLQLQDSSSKIRYNLIRNAFWFFIETPLIGGSNWAQNTKGEYPHNLVLEAFTNLGIIGGGLFLMLIGAGIIFAWKNIRQGRNFYALLYIQTVIAGMFSGSLFAHAQFWVLLAILLHGTNRDQTQNIG